MIFIAQIAFVVCCLLLLILILFWRLWRQEDELTAIKKYLSEREGDGK